MPPTVYTFDFKDVPLKKYAEALDVLFHDPDFCDDVDKRNRLVKSSDRMKRRSSELANLFRTVQQRDRLLADKIFASIVQANIHSDQTNDFLTFSTLLKYYVDYSREGMADRVDNLACGLDKVMFLADILEKILLDIKDDMQYVFNGQIKFTQFDAVSQVLKQLSSFFVSTRSDDTSTPAAKLYMEYSDSINAYLKKRLKTYTQKYRKMFPESHAYTETEMLSALNQFFGTEKFFGPNFIKHTDTGGSYIDAFAVAFNLSPQQTEKLESVVTKDVSELCHGNHLQYCFAVTDAIMKYYKKEL